MIAARVVQCQPVELLQPLSITKKIINEQLHESPWLHSAHHNAASKTNIWREASKHEYLLDAVMHLQLKSKVRGLHN